MQNLIIFFKLLHTVRARSIQTFRLLERETLPLTTSQLVTPTRMGSGKCPSYIPNKA